MTIAIQKPEKPKQPVENLQAITLLSMRRKVLAICLKKQIIPKINTEIPPRKAAYRKGRSITEHVFATKLPAGKTIILENHTVYLLLLHMPKTLNTVDRTIPIKYLNNSIDNNKLHLINVMLDTEMIQYDAEIKTANRFKRILAHHRETF